MSNPGRISIKRGIIGKAFAGVRVWLRTIGSDLQMLSTRMVNEIGLSDLVHHITVR